MAGEAGGSRPWELQEGLWGSEESVLSSKSGGTGLADHPPLGPSAGLPRAALAAPHFLHIREKSKRDGLRLFHLFTAFVQAYFWQGSRQ